MRAASASVPHEFLGFNCQFFGESMDISCFDDLLLAARSQPLPQRLLFVFCAAELPANATDEQAARFHAVQGGALSPLMCVDKSPSELDSFTTLTDEATQFGQSWNMVFAAAISGPPGQPPSAESVESALRGMLQDIQHGRLGAYIPFDPLGNAFRIE